MEESVVKPDITEVPGGREIERKLFRREAARRRAAIAAIAIVSLTIPATLAAIQPDPGMIQDYHPHQH